MPAAAFRVDCSAVLAAQGTQTQSTRGAPLRNLPKNTATSERSVLAAFAATDASVKAPDSLPVSAVCSASKDRHEDCSTEPASQSSPPVCIPDTEQACPPVEDSQQGGEAAVLPRCDALVIDGDPVQPSRLSPVVEEDALQGDIHEHLADEAVNTAETHQADGNSCQVWRISHLS